MNLSRDLADFIMKGEISLHGKISQGRSPVQERQDGEVDLDLGP